MGVMFGKSTVEYDEGRWDRPIKDGTYLAEIVDFNDEYRTKADPNRVGLLVVFRTLNATKEQAPQGPLKIDWYVFPGSNELKQFAEILEPRLLTEEDVEIKAENYLHRKLYIAVSMHRVKNRPIVTKVSMQ